MHPRIKFTVSIDPQLGMQAASTKLHLAMLLRASPIIAEAIVTNCKGAKFFDIFVLDIGCEHRVNVGDIVPGPLDPAWNTVTGCAPLTLDSGRHIVCIFVEVMFIA